MTVAFMGGPWDGQVHEVDTAAARILCDPRLYKTGAITHAVYAYTGYVPSLDTAFARFEEIRVLW